MHNDGFVELTGQSLLLTKTCVKPAECEHNCRENLIQNFYNSCNFELGTQVCMRLSARSIFVLAVFFRKWEPLKNQDAVSKVVIIPHILFCNNISQIAIIRDLASSR